MKKYTYIYFIFGVVFLLTSMGLTMEKAPAEKPSEMKAVTATVNDDVVVKKALKVFKDKAAEDQRKEKVWYIKKQDGTTSVIVEHEYTSTDGSVVFSPNKDYVYYLGSATNGASVVYGINLGTDAVFTIGTAGSFYVETCPDNSSYVILQEDGETKKFIAYDLTGNAIDVESPGTYEDMLQNVCY